MIFSVLMLTREYLDNLYQAILLLIDYQIPISDTFPAISVISMDMMSTCIFCFTNLSMNLHPTTIATQKLSTQDVFVAASNKLSIHLYVYTSIIVLNLYIIGYAAILPCRDSALTVSRRYEFS